jgi:xyloglucan-specific exo-beta-1,4-glucanase
MAAGSGQSRHRWYTAIGVVAGLGLLAGGLLLALPGSTPATHTLAADCGLVHCGAAVPAPATAVFAPASPRALLRHRPYQPVPVTKRAPQVTPTPPARPAAPAVTVSYSEFGHGNSGRFSTQVTLVNHGSSPVSGWTLRLSYPGDQVFWVGWPGGQFVNWQFSGGTLTLSAQAVGETLAPGGTQSIMVSGAGSSPAPAGCAFNGSGC